MTTEEFLRLTERQAVIRSRAGVYNHIELGYQPCTDIWVITKTYHLQMDYLTVVHYCRPTTVNRDSDHCGCTAEFWKFHEQERTEEMLQKWPEEWRVPEQIIYDTVTATNKNPKRMDPIKSIGLLRHLSRIEMWLEVRSAYPEAEDVWDKWNRTELTKHLGQMSNRVTGVIAEQLRFWSGMGKSLSSFATESTPPDICI